MTSVSTRFFGQPRLTKWIFFGIVDRGIYENFAATQPEARRQRAFGSPAT
jgi:hypothetical protein